MTKIHSFVCSLAWLLLAPTVAAHAETVDDVRPCLRSGEVLTFVVYGVLLFKVEGGRLRIETTQQTASDAARIRIHSALASTLTLYKYRNDSDSLIDAGTGRLLQTQAKGIDRSKPFDRVTDLDHDAGRLHHTDRIRAQKSYQDALPARLIDLSVAMLCARFWDLAVGESRDVSMVYEGLLYDLNVKAQREEKVETPLGKFTAVVLVPSQRGEPKGAFKKGAAFKLYVSREQPPRLVRFDSLASAIDLIALLESVEEGTPIATLPAPSAGQPPPPGT